jgi:HlyD family secretion protein
MRWLLRHKKLIGAVIVVAGIVAVAMWPTTLEVDVATVARGDMQVTLDEEGETRVRDRFVVSAPVAGRLQRIELEPGDRVIRRKTIVARLAPGAAPLLDPRTRIELGAAVEAAKAAIGQAQAERDRAATALERAKTTLTRQEALAKAGAIASDELEAATTAQRTAAEALRSADFAVTRSRHELELAEARLQAPGASGGRTVDVIAPVDGVILKRLRESETMVPAGEPLVEIGDPRRMEIVADFLSTDAVRVLPGAPVIIEQWGGGEPLHGKVRRVEPSGFMKVSALGVEEQRVNVLIDFVDPPAAIKQLGDAYRVEVRAVIWRESGVLKVPVGALFRRGEGWAVFVVDQERATLTVVQLGQRNEVEGQVLGGLSEGQTVVMHPPDTLMDGMQVAPRMAP